LPGRRYVALLRGINLAGRNRVPMARLREVCEAAGATNVRTYIASGNVVLDSELSAAALRERMEHDIKTEFGIAIVVVVLTAAELAAAISKNPYKKAEPGTLHVAFAPSDFAKADVDRLHKLDFPVEELAVIGRQIYYHLPNGYGNAQLPREIDRAKLKVTARNWRTVLALNEMAAATIDS
jgi:uncharacterized protein (DUF1697 family)